MNTAIFILNLLFTIAIYSSPIIIYRYAIRKAPVLIKKAKRITIIYGICAFVVMTIIITIVRGSGAPGGAILLWSWVNYRVLIGGKDRRNTPQEFPEEDLSPAPGHIYIPADHVENVANVPDDNEFCQFCVIKTEDEAVVENTLGQAATSENEQPSTTESAISPTFVAPSEINSVIVQEPKKKNVKNRYCKLCGGLIDYQTKECESCGKQYFKFKPSVSIVVLAFFLITSVAFNVYQYYHSRDDITSLENTILSQNTRISSLEDTVSSLESTISSQKSKISSLSAKVEYFSDKAESYDDLILALSSEDLGYAASNFKSDESVNGVSENQMSVRDTLIANARRRLEEKEKQGDVNTVPSSVTGNTGDSSAREELIADIKGKPKERETGNN